MIVSKEIARKLRDIGFREPTDYLYNHYGEEMRQDRSSGNQLYVDKGYDNCDAPDKSDVFAWFRKKGMCGVIDWIQTKDYYVYDVYTKTNTMNNGVKFSSWEEAEDACILKMIELCESKL